MFKSKDNLQLFTREWKAKNPNAIIFLVHGYAEHVERYAHLAAFLNEHNISLYGIDLRGHGKSEGKRAYIDSFNQFTDDVDSWLKQYSHLELPTYIYGHSMGGLVSTAYLQKYACPLKQFSGLLLSAPAFMPKKDMAPTLIKFSSVIGKYLPKLKTIKLDPNLISSDPNEVEKYINDPLVYSGKWYARTAAELIAKMKEVQNKARSFNFPIFIAHGQKDGLTEIEGSKIFYNKINSEDKTLHLVEGAYHELVNEPTKADFMNLMLNWISDRS